MPPLRLSSFGLAFWLALLCHVQGQWRTESFDLPQGWSAIHIPIDTDAELIDTLLTEYESVVELWQWNPEGLDAVILDDPDSPEETAEWRYWKRGNPAGSTLNVLAPNRSYLVHTTAATTLALKGRVVAPNVEWRTDGLNLLGFQTNASTPPTAEAFLSPTQLLDQAAEIFGYVGGDLEEGVNPQALQARFAPIKRNQAYWLRTSKYADYDGPIRVRTALGDSLDFGAEAATDRIVLANRTDRQITVTLTPQVSESAPGESAAPPAVPLLRELIDDATGERSYVAFGTSHDVVLGANQTASLVVAVDRVALTGPPGTESVSLLQVTDGENVIEVYLPVLAEAANLSGLWVGSAEVSHVQNQLEDSSNVEPVAERFPLPLIVHIDEVGKATLLSQAYHGAVAESETEGFTFGVSSKESALMSQHLKSASRFSATHLPLNTALAFTGTASTGGSLTGSLTIGYNAPTNPLLHPYHPDHDNLDERFENTLPNGVESHTITRDFDLSLHASAPEGIHDPNWGTTLLTGDYQETLSGLHKQAIQTRGLFALRKVASNVALILP